MVRQVGKGSLPSSGVLRQEAQEGKHGQTGVLNLLNLQGGRGRGVLGEASKVENTAGISGGVASRQLVVAEEGVLVDGAGIFEVLETIDFHKVEEDEFDDEEGLGGDTIAAGVSAGGVPVVAGEFGTEDAGNAQHGPTAVLEFGLDIPLQGLGGLGETEGVEAKVSGERSIQVRGDGLGVSGVPGARGAGSLNDDARAASGLHESKGVVVGGERKCIVCVGGGVGGWGWKKKRDRRKGDD